MANCRPNDYIADLSGLAVSDDANPFSGFIAACGDDVNTIRQAYEAHRSKRNAAQAEKFLAEGTQLAPDAILRSIIQAKVPDERNCLVIWTRPPAHIIDLACTLQAKISASLPESWQHWLMPPQNMHMTIVEAAFSQPPAAIRALIAPLRTHLPRIAHFAYTHRARLVRPLLCIDTSAFALSFVPAAGERVLATTGAAMSATDDDDDATEVECRDAYTYHHLRRDVFALVADAGVAPAPRYQVPSAHITLGRFVGAETKIAKHDAQRVVQAVNEINDWLAKTYAANDDPLDSAEWIVGQERGLEVRYGPVWYGGGKSLIVGEGF